jgi:hypothetical protein
MNNNKLKPLTISPKTLNFEILTPGDNKTLRVQIKNPNKQPVIWHADNNGTKWLYLNESEKAGKLVPGEPRTINVHVNTDSLIAGRHAAALTFTAEEDKKSVSAQLPVILAISLARSLPSEEQQSFVVSPFEVGLNFTLNLISDHTLPLTITNWDRRNKLHWNANADGTNWLKLDRYKGDLQPGERQTIYVTADTSLLKLGDYPSTLSFSTTVAGVSSTVQIQAELHAGVIAYSDSGPKPPKAIPTSLDFGTVDYKKCLNITNQDSHPVTLIMDNRGKPWLTLDDMNAITPIILQPNGKPNDTTQVTVKIIRTDLPVSPNYNMDLMPTVTFIDQALGNESASTPVPVTMAVP